MKITDLGILVASILTLTSTAAPAAVLTYTYEGTVRSGYDAAGLFGTKLDLSGLHFTFVGTFDTLAASLHTDNSTFSYELGGFENLAPNFGDATLSINYQNPFLLGNGEADISNVKGRNITSFASYASEFGFNFLESVTFKALSSDISYDFGKPIRLSSANSDFEGEFAYNKSLYSLPFNGTYLYNYEESVIFDVTTLVVTNSLSAVPLPSSAPLFAAALFALSGAGLAAKRKKNSRMV